MLKLYDSLTKKEETFEPVIPGTVRMYVCGPTVYSDIHLGNARPVVFFDILRRYLEHLGYAVTYASNITDIDDKIIERAKEEGKEERIITEEYTRRFFEMTRVVGSEIPELTPKATDYVPGMIAYISDLIEQGQAYETPSGVYFRIKSVPDYGLLSGQDIDLLDQGVRIELESDKEDPRDFSLWKNTDEGLSFPSPFGMGRPGWHTECAVMNHDLFKSEIDIHGGGTDLRFPHHENEIAQTMAHDHHHLARFWMHVGRLDVDHVKMSKSIGNVVLVKDLIKTVPPLSFRLLLTGHHYRQQIHYSDDLMAQFEAEYDRITRTLKKTVLALTVSKTPFMNNDKDLMARFETHMNDDINTPNVITLIQEILKSMNKTKDPFRLSSLYVTARTILTILGLMPDVTLEDDTIRTFFAWDEARKAKDFQSADRYRETLTQEGWI
ncbi:MAG: cysteine--tRNA ligase [Acholeplasmataceae bacterium]|nr:cysteine--tRNA ligase [Acholeplasmataceae bacterium]